MSTRSFALELGWDLRETQLLLPLPARRIADGLNGRDVSKRIGDAQRGNPRPLPLDIVEGEAPPLVAGPHRADIALAPDIMNNAKPSRAGIRRRDFRAPRPSPVRVSEEHERSRCPALPRR